MATDPLPIGEDILHQALAYMESALELLDRTSISAHIGARLDHAICDLRTTLGADEPSSDPGALASRPS